MQLHYLLKDSTPAHSNSLIVFLHGFPETCYLWEQQLRSNISGTSKLVALDLPGCGGSDSHSFYGPDEMLNAVAESIVQIKGRYLRASSVSGLPPKTILVSHDW